jgi:hypothetical protein
MVYFQTVMPGLVPGIPIQWAWCPAKRDGWDEPGHDESKNASSL